MTTDYLAAVDRAEALFREGFSCSQAVLMAFAPGLGMDERQAATDRGVFKTLCPELVRTAATLVAETLAAQVSPLRA